MAQFYTLDEAARVLGMSLDDLKVKAQTREVRAFMDSGSWRFRVADIDEMARRRGMGSDPDLSLSDLDLQIAPAGGSGVGTGSEELLLSEFQLGVARPDLGGPRSNEIRPGDGFGSGEQDVLLDESSMPPNPIGGSSSVILGMPTAKGKLPTDSDVRLVPDNPKGASDSDVRLGAKLRPSDSDVKIGPATPKLGVRPSDSDMTFISDEGTAQGSSDIFKAARPPAPGRPGVSVGSSSDELVSGDFGEGESDFELTPSSVIDALQPESGSDFELRALDASDEFDATPARGPSDSDVTGAEPAASGINLGRPSDSGINLQSVGFNLDADSIELAPLDDDSSFGMPTAPAAKKKPDPSATALPGKKVDLSATALPGKKVDLSATALPMRGAKADLSATALPVQGKKADLSATALPVKAKGEKDIFEDTDFEVDAVDGSSGDDRTMQLEAASDFDVDDGESESQVFALDEEDVDQNASTAMGPSVVGDSDEFEDGGDGASGEMDAGDAWDVDDVPTPSAVTRGVSASSVASPALAPASQAEWGGLWVGMLIVSSVFVLLLTFVGIDLIRNMYDFQGDVPVASGLVRTLAGMVGG